MIHFSDVSAQLEESEGQRKRINEYILEGG
jgi:hypothetical protein